MADKPIDGTSGFRFGSREKTEMKRQSKETVSGSRWDDDAGSTRQSLRRFREIDSWELDGSVYIGEGNATMVVSLPHERKVIRFRKSENVSDHGIPDDGGKRRAEMLVDFFDNVIFELMGRWTNKPVIVRCSPNNVERWMSLFEKQRPEYRCHKKVVDTYATALPDYTLLPGYLHDKLPPGNDRSTFCVEIKPKQGFVDDLASMFRDKCEYCRRQHDKLSEGKISSTSKYCPCDLFSGQLIRMRRAIEGLTDSPQNNFRIFENGRLVWGEGFEPKQLNNVVGKLFFNDENFNAEASREMLFQLICEALLRPFAEKSSNCVSKVIENVDEDDVEKSLPDDSVLNQILHVQKLHNHSFDKVYDIYSSYEKILTDEMIYFNKNVKLSDNSDSNDENSLPSVEELEILRKYLLFRLAKDCSILIAFRQIQSSDIHVLPAENVIRISDSRFFAFHNAITDLDPKSVHSISKHHRRRTSEIAKITTQGQNGCHRDDINATE